MLLMYGGPTIPSVQANRSMPAGAANEAEWAALRKGPVRLWGMRNGRVIRVPTTNVTVG